MLVVKGEIHCDDHYQFHIHPQFIYESFHLHYVISLLSQENKNSQLTSLPMCGFIAQLVEHRTGIAEVTGSNPVEALNFFQASLFQLLKLEIHCDDHLFTTFIYIRSSYMNHFIYYIMVSIYCSPTICC